MSELSEEEMYLEKHYGMPRKDSRIGRMFISKRNLNPAYFTLAERLGAHVVVLNRSKEEKNDVE